MPIRPATLDDTHAICELFRARIERWQRINKDGSVVDQPPDDLTVHERWMHGGPWMSIETAAVWLSYLRHSGAHTLVATGEDDTVIAYSEAYAGKEPAPYQQHIHIAQLVGDENAQPLLLEHFEQAMNGGKRLTMSASAYDEPFKQFMRTNGFQPISTVQQAKIAAQGTSVGFYQVVDAPHLEIEHINGWGMPIGRRQSARYHWAQLVPAHWRAAPQIESQQRILRKRFNVAGQEAIVCSQEALFDARTATLYCWTPKALNKPLIAAIRSWAHKEGYRTLNLDLEENQLALLAGDAQASPYQHIVYARELR